MIRGKKGLLSLSELEKQGIKIPVPGGNEWSHRADKIKGMNKYVHLCFLDDHPMFDRVQFDGRIRDPIWLKIDSSILLKDEVRFCIDVSNKSGVSILSPKEAIEQIDFEVLFAHQNHNDPKIRARLYAAKKSEILVPNFVPIERIFF